MKNRADMMVVSATPAEALHREWEEHGIDQYVALIAGQELGKKEELLGLTVQGKYAAGHVLMMGDALSDLKAARAAGTLFYPVVPGREDESWRIFQEATIEQFLSGQYTQDTEAKFLTDFEKTPPKTPRLKAYPSA